MLRVLVLSLMCLLLSAILLEATTAVTTQPFGKLPDGTAIEIFTLKSEKVEARIMTYGGILVSLKAPDRNARVADVVLGYDSVDGYYANSNNPGTAYFGALIGRYANRIGGASFKLGEKKYSLPANNGANTLHGGPHVRVENLGSAVHLYRPCPRARHGCLGAGQRHR